MLNSLTQSFSNWLQQSPLTHKTCPLCSTPSADLICENCTAMLPTISQQCFQCGLPLSIDTETNATNIPATKLRCGKCLTSPPAFDVCISPFHYALPINQFITQLKFRQKLHYANILAELLITKIESHSERLPDCIIPVPLHKSRLRQRGFNQALEIAKPIAKKYAIELDTKSCVRIISTPPQMEQNKESRKNNIRNAFTVSKEFKHTHIVLVDDVMTTGNTLNEISKAFRKQGVKRIQVWAVARS